MKLIKPSFEVWEQSSGLEGIYKQIERCGRVCYKSEDKITEDSAKPFVGRIINSGHTSVLEHGTVYLDVPYNPFSNTVQPHMKYRSNKYSIVHNDMSTSIGCAAITTNMRVLVENNWLDDLKYLCEPTDFHEKRITVHFVCDRGILAEFTRHKLLCVA